MAPAQTSEFARSSTVSVCTPRSMGRTADWRTIVTESDDPSLFEHENALSAA